MHQFNLSIIDSSWKDCIASGLKELDTNYLDHLSKSKEWLPGNEKIFSAFSLPVDNVNYVLFGESPYPRAESANGYAFWDAAVQELWSSNGLSKTVNRATSLRNIIKMLLIAEGLLDINEITQEAIVRVCKNHLVQTNAELFDNFLKHGILLLNATPVLQLHSPHKDAKSWYPFTNVLINFLIQKRPHVKLLLFGRIASSIEDMVTIYPNTGNVVIEKLYAEHPYNLSFIKNKRVLEFFKPLHLLRK